MDTSVHCAAVGVRDHEVREEGVARQKDRVLSVWIQLRILKPAAKPENAFRIEERRKAQKRMGARKR